MTLPELLTPDYWFNLTPPRMSPAMEIIFFVVFALFVFAGAAFRILRKNRTDKFERIILTKLANIATTYGALGLVWLFFTYQEISHFGMRLWFLVGLIAFIVSLVKLYRYAKITVPQLRQQEQSKAEANKYLPRSNRR